MSTWHAYAIIAALTGGMAAILTKAGAAGVPVTLAVLLRTAVVLMLSTVLVASARAEQNWAALTPRAIAFLALSAVATAASWFAYVRALQLGPVTGVASIDRLSLVVAIVLAAVWFGEPITWRVVAGITLMLTGALLLIRP